MFNIPPRHRYERKFNIVDGERIFVLEQIRRHPAMFREIYVPRQVNNIYLDTPNLKFYHDNKSGIAQRKKVRIRWYGDRMGNIENPKLEYKIKNNMVGDKWTFDLPGFDLNDDVYTAKIQLLFAKANLPPPIAEDLARLRPTLLNTYQRTYFLSHNRHFRLTFDEEMHYYGLLQLQQISSAVKEVANQYVIELKYNLDMDDSAQTITHRFPWRIDKNSKYVNGIEQTLQLRLR